MDSVAIIGAGISGLAAAQVICEAGESVTLYERSRDIGGRVTSREHRGFIYDPGAQYIKGESALTNSLLEGRFRTPDLIGIGKPVWTFDAHNTVNEGDPLQNAAPKWNYRYGLRSLVNRLAEGLQIQRETSIAAIEHTQESWRLFDTRGEQVGEARRLLVTVPAPLLLDLIASSPLPPNPQRSTELANRLTEAAYNPLISLTFAFDRPIKERPYYALVNSDKAHAISWLAWEHYKAPERAPAGGSMLTAQMAPDYSIDHWETDNRDLAREVIRLIETLLNEELPAPLFTDVLRWHHALPRELANGKHVNEHLLPHRLAVAGDSYTGGRVHLAIEYSMDVAKQLLAQP